MVKEIQLRVNLQEEKQQKDILKKKASKFLNVDFDEIKAIKILRKSIDARKPLIVFHYKIYQMTKIIAPF